MITFSLYQPRSLEKGVCRSTDGREVGKSLMPLGVAPTGVERGQLCCLVPASLDFSGLHSGLSPRPLTKKKKDKAGNVEGWVQQDFANLTASPGLSDSSLVLEMLSAIQTHVSNL